MDIIGPGAAAQVTDPLPDLLRAAREAAQEALAEAESRVDSLGDPRVYNLLDEALSSVEAAQEALAELSR